MQQNPQPDPSKPAETLHLAARGADTFDDMHDTEEELSRYAAIARTLRLCRPIEDGFDAADEWAVKFQRRHHWLTRGAALFGTLAVVFAIIGLSRGEQELWSAPWLPTKEKLDWVELWLAGIAVAIVLAGWVSHYKERWLQWRHQAESCRLLRYNFLTHPSVWRGREEDAQFWIEGKLNAIRHTELDKAVREPTPHGPFEGTQSKLPLPVLRVLTEYYLSKRLNPQKEYLANRTQRNEFSDWIRAYLPWFFYVSIVAVFFKFFVRDFSVRWERLLALLAALLPAAAAGVRTWRSAFEFSRNKGRFEAAHQALRDLEGRLVNEGFAASEKPSGRLSGPGGEKGGEEADAYPILRDLSWCEHILESEHREWLRLMYETEWFG
jgi:hypothetical protein